MSDDDEITRLTIRLQSDTVDELRDELSHFNTDAARFQFLAQFYLDYKEMDGQPMPVEITREKDSDESNESEETGQ